MTETHTHSHTHESHEHGPHTHTHESYDHVKGGPVVLDIGGDIGALLVTLPESSLGTELHLKRATDPDADVHTGVWKRGPEGQEQPTAVFMELVEGRYTVLDADGGDVVEVDITGGAVEMLDLR